jgi:hypothetical protein
MSFKKKFSTGDDAFDVFPGAQSQNQGDNNSVVSGHGCMDQPGGFQMQTDAAGGFGSRAAGALNQS